MNLAKKIWKDPVGSKVIAAGIIAGLGFAVGHYGEFLGLAQNAVKSATAAIWTVSAIVALMSLFYVFRRWRNKRQIHNMNASLARQFSKNSTFVKAFVESHNSEDYFKRLGHTSQARSLRDDLIDNHLVRDSNAAIPRLNQRGKEVLKLVIGD